MKAVNMIIQDDDMKVLKPLLDKLDVDYTQKTLKVEDDPEIMAIAERVKNDKPASKKESNAISKKIRERIQAGK